MITGIHREDVKAAIRKRYGTIKAFTRAHGLAPTSVTDLFRGRTSAPTEQAIKKMLSEEGRQSSFVDNSRRKKAPHCQSAKVKSS